MRSAGLIVILLATAGTAAADAEVRRVALVGASDRVRAAVSSALEPWEIEVVEVGERTRVPGPAMPANVEEARSLGQQYRSEAVVWLSGGDGGAALWLYDAEDDRVVARELPHPPPFDEPTAAEVALSVKTLLRHSAAAPEAERFGARGGASRRERVPRQSPPLALEVESLAALRLRATSAANVEPRLGVGLLWTPAPLGERYAAALLLRAGPGVNVSAPSFVGHLSDLSLGVAGRAAVEVGGPLRLSGGLGATLHVTRLEGAVLPQDQRADAARLNPSLDAGLLLELLVGPRLRLQLRTEGALALRRQRYLVRGEEVLELPPYELELGLGLAVPVH